jgi:hypothetical protein
MPMPRKASINYNIDSFDQSNNNLANGLAARDKVNELDEFERACKAIAIDSSNADIPDARDDNYIYKT